MNRDKIIAELLSLCIKFTPNDWRDLKLMVRKVPMKVKTPKEWEMPEEMYITDFVGLSMYLSPHPEQIVYGAPFCTLNDIDDVCLSTLLGLVKHLSN